MEYGNGKGTFLADDSGPSLQPVVHMEASHPLTVCGILFNGFLISTW